MGNSDVENREKNHCFDSNKKWGIVIIIFTKSNDEKENIVLSYAKKELTYYMGKVTNEFTDEDYTFTLEIMGEIEEKKDYFSYQVKERQGYIQGNNARSVLLGVYSYLRAIGFEFPYPGKSGEIIPEISSYQQLEIEETSVQADYFHRGVCIEGANSLENVLEFIEWLPKMGFNSFFIQFKKPDVFFERWYQHIFNPTLKLEEKTREELDTMLEAVIEALKKRGLILHRVGHGWTAECLGFDSSGWQESKKEISPDIKEMVALINKERKLWKNVPANTNLCYSSERVKERISDLVVEFAKKERETDYIHFWLADECNNICECENCKKSILSDQYVEILNRIDEKLEKEQMQTKIVFLLYQELLYAPQKERIKNPERFCLMFAPISRDFEHSYPKELPQVTITPYKRNRFMLPQKIDENLEMYKLWLDTYEGEIFFYDYPLGRAHYGDFGYMKISKVIYDDIEALKTLKSHGYMSCQELRIMTPTGLPNYIMGNRLLYKDCDFETLRRKYFSALYGRAGEECINYLQRLSDLSDTNYFNGHGPRVQPQLSHNFRQIETIIEEFLPRIVELQESVSQQHSKNLEHLKYHGEYSKRLAKALYYLSMGEEEAANKYYEEFCVYVQGIEKEIQQYLDVYRIIEVSTKYTGFKLK